MRITILASVLAGGSLVVCAGCGGQPNVPGALAVGQPVPVKGKVLFRGKPLAQGRLTLEPTDGGRDATGAIQADGRFTLTTNQPDDGAVLGVHRVVVSDAGPQVRPTRETHVRIVEGQSEYTIDLK